MFFLIETLRKFEQVELTQNLLRELEGLWEKIDHIEPVASHSFSQFYRHGDADSRSLNTGAKSAASGSNLYLYGGRSVVGGGAGTIYGGIGGTGGVGLESEWQSNAPLHSETERLHIEIRKMRKKLIEIEKRLENMQNSKYSIWMSLFPVLKSVTINMVTIVLLWAILKQYKKRVGGGPSSLVFDL